MESTAPLPDETALKNVVVSALEIAHTAYRPDLQMHDVPAWDSVAHLNLIFAIEEAFAVKFQTELIPQLDSIAKLRAAIAQGAAFDPGSMA